MIVTNGWSICRNGLGDKKDRDVYIIAMTTKFKNVQEHI